MKELEKRGGPVVYNAKSVTFSYTTIGKFLVTVSPCFLKCKIT